MTREEAKEHFWKDTEKFGESVAKRFGSINYNKIFTSYYIGSEIDMFIDKIYDYFENRTCESCKHFEVDDTIDTNKCFGWCNNIVSCTKSNICDIDFYCKYWENKND